MASLKEIKGRINSVKSTLKITSAMKMVASAKLRKSQTAIANMLPYQSRLQSMLNIVGGADAGYGQNAPSSSRVAVVAFASNSSLCGGFNSNVIKETRACVASLVAQGMEVTVFSVGRKMAEAMKKSGYVSPQDFTELSAHPEYSGSSCLADMLCDAYREGGFSRILLVYNHCVSTSTQKPVVETYLPMEMSQDGCVRDEDEYIIEPGKEEIVEELLPKVLRLKIYTVLLDSAAAEHSARAVAMQTATDNGNALLQDLTLAYNKGRQYKITAEILDLMGGQQA